MELRKVRATHGPVLSLRTDHAAGSTFECLPRNGYSTPDGSEGSTSLYSLSSRAHSDNSLTGFAFGGTRARGTRSMQEPYEFEDMGDDGPTYGNDIASDHDNFSGFYTETNASFTRNAPYGSSSSRTIDTRRQFFESMPDEDDGNSGRRDRKRKRNAAKTYDGSPKPRSQRRRGHMFGTSSEDSIPIDDSEDENQDAPVPSSSARAARPRQTVHTGMSVEDGIEIDSDENYTPLNTRSSTRNRAPSFRIDPRSGSTRAGARTRPGTSRTNVSSDDHERAEATPPRRQVSLWNRPNVSARSFRYSLGQDAIRAPALIGLYLTEDDSYDLVRHVWLGVYIGRMCHDSCGSKGYCVYIARIGERRMGRD